MNIVLLQGQMQLEEIDLLLKEFPQYLFISLSEATYKSLSREQWARIEIVYGSRFTREDLLMAHQLRWIHSPNPHLSRLCLGDIEKQGNILITNTTDENIPQIGEYVIGGILAFAKNLYGWRDAIRNPALVWDSKWRDSMMTLKNKVLLEVGLGRVGTEVTKRARAMDMQVWGVQEGTSFHRYCHKTFGLKELHSVLPAADVVCLTLPRGKDYFNWFGAEEMALMKEGAILIVVGASSIVDADALYRTALTGKFRGVMIDTVYQTPVAPNSPLWKVPNIILTPEVGPRPKSEERQSFRVFLYNLRQYIHGNFKDMRNLVETKVSLKVS